jgi:hypothetical protein
VYAFVGPGCGHDRVRPGANMGRPVGPYAWMDRKQGSSMSAGSAVDETTRFEQLVADLKIPSSDLTGVPQELADAIAQAGLETSTGTTPRWPQWAFELAKAALLSQQCSAAEALQAVTRSGGRGGPGGGVTGGHGGRV